jgi:MarR family 2-MHQ and catechol resistance regulon transcriptional repressor
MAGDGRQAAALAAYVKLNRATRAVLAAVEPRLAAAGLTLTQLGVLEAVLHKGPMTQRELGRKVLTSAGNMTDVIDKLVRRGLIRRGQRDGRSVQVELTGPGESLIRALFPDHARDIEAAFGTLTDQELATLDRVLRKLGLCAAALDVGGMAPQIAP